MTDEERREMVRKNYAMQMNMLGYHADGNKKDMVEVVRCKDCVNSGTSRCPCHYSGDPFIDWDPDDDWFCADGEARE